MYIFYLYYLPRIQWTKYESHDINIPPKNFSALILEKFNGTLNKFGIKQFLFRTKVYYLNILEKNKLFY